MPTENAWTLNASDRLEIIGKTPEALPYDWENKPKSAWYINDGNRITNDIIPESIGWQQPYPIGKWYLTDKLRLYANGIPEPFPYGAFMYDTELEYISIPESVKSIGKYAFTYTALTKVRIARDCTYYPTSFPDGCEIWYYDEEAEATDYGAQLSALAARVAALEGGN